MTVRDIALYAEHEVGPLPPPPPPNTLLYFVVTAVHTVDFQENARMHLCHAAVNLCTKCMCTEVEFLEEIQTEVLRVFLLAIHRHLY